MEITIRYPDEAMIKEKKFEKNILWMVYNNETCGWSDFRKIEISQSTLSNHLSALKRKSYITKLARDKYQITSEGRKRFIELESNIKKKKVLKYPPKAIKQSRNYDHIILWMLYNNNYCKWSNFIEDPLSINNSSLSKNLKILRDAQFVIKENQEYLITDSGKIEYSRMLKSYNLDRQAILDEESRRIEEITKHVITFFKNHDIKDEDIRFRFLNHVLKLDHTRVKSTLASIADFYKILLYLSINHPNQYPEYISLRDFSIKYKIEETTLKYYIMEIVEKEIYQIKFFKLETEDDKVYRSFSG